EGNFPLLDGHGKYGSCYRPRGCTHPREYGEGILIVNTNQMNKMKSMLFLVLAVFAIVPFRSYSQQISKEEMLFLTPLWKGERFADGRPKVSDDLLRRLKLVTHEEAWAVMKNKGFAYQYAEG